MVIIAEKKHTNYLLINSTASSYFIPLSISANATRTGALPSPATQWTATQDPGFSLNFPFISLSQSSTTFFGGAAPSSNGQSWRNQHRNYHLATKSVKEKKKDEF